MATAEPEKRAVGIELDPLPDNDSFLPRYLTVQLLEILTKTIGAPAAISANMQEFATKNAKFIESFQSQELFTNLTYSIFWRADITKTLADNINQIDLTDKYNRAPLTLAISNEDFPLAVNLLQHGATLMLEDKLVLEIALISMIQRKQEIIEQILNVGGEYDLSWVKEYLDYLLSYIKGEPKIKSLRYHEVLNPPLRHFGQVLDTLAYFNGLPSHYGFLSPSIEILSTHLRIYADELTDPTAKDLFNTIAIAYEKTNSFCKYYGNLPTEADATKNLTAQINANINSKNKDVTILFGGWAGNSVAIAFIDKVLIFSNLGAGGNPDAGTKIFKIKNPAGITEELVEIFIRGLGNACSPVEIFALIGNVVDPKPLFSLKQTFNPIDNCIFVNPRAVVQGILLALTVFSKETVATTGNLTTATTPALELFTAYVTSLYKYSTADLAKFMRNNELLQNKRIECCALAIDYINQHCKEPGAISRCIELKNALEFVGLKDFFIANVDPEAQTAIQAFTIKEQEATAMQVIEQENILAASQGKE